MIFESIEIENYKGISKLHFKPKKINVLVGKNNTGKTSVLEAINLLFQDNDIKTKSMSSLFNIYSKNKLITITANTSQKPLNIVIKEATETEAINMFSKEFINYFLDNLSNEKKTYTQFAKEFENVVIESLSLELRSFIIKNSLVLSKRETEKIIHCNIDIYMIDKMQELVENLIKYMDKLIPEETKKENLGKIRNAATAAIYSQSGFNIGKDKFKSKQISVVYIKSMLDEIKTAFSRRLPEDAERLHKIEDLVKEHNLIENLESLDFDNVLFATKNGIKAHAFNFLGDGFKAIIGLLWQLSSKNIKDSVILLDEPENHMHPGYVKDLITFIVDYSRKYNIQFFLTTHSPDVLDVFLSKNLDNDQMLYLKNEFNLLKMGKIKDETTIAQCLNYDQSMESEQELFLDLRGI